MDEDGFDYMKIQFLRDIKAQNRSLRFVFGPIVIYHIATFVNFDMSLFIKCHVQRLFKDLRSF